MCGLHNTYISETLQVTKARFAQTADAVLMEEMGLIVKEIKWRNKEVRINTKISLTQSKCAPLLREILYVTWI